jgi:hypothetical protein
MRLGGRVLVRKIAGHADPDHDRLRLLRMRYGG